MSVYDFIPPDLAKSGKAKFENSTDSLKKVGIDTSFESLNKFQITRPAEKLAFFLHIIQTDT